MKVLFVAPEIRVDSVPYHFPFWIGILGAIVEKKSGNVATLDLNSRGERTGAPSFSRARSARR